MKRGCFKTLIAVALIASIGCAQRPVTPDNKIALPHPLPAENIGGSSIERDLVIAVRERRDPQLALDSVQKILNEKQLPTQAKMDARVWRLSIQEWLKEPKYKKSGSGRALEQAKNLMAKGWRYTSRITPNQAGLIYYLRAANNLTDILSKGENNEEYGEALYYAGMNSEVLREWNLLADGADYYEACIRYRPYSLLAQKCFGRLQVMNHGPTPERIRGLRDMVERQQGQFLDWGFID